jgi:hypothetical protein
MLKIFPDSIFLVYYFFFDKANAIFAPISALLLTNEIFDFKLLPFVNSLTLFSKKGVIFAPKIFC